jgi:DNA-binding CsgD family transcriptional regulator
MITIKKGKKVYNSLAEACREEGFPYDSVYDMMRKKGLTAQQVFDYYVENRPAASPLYTENDIQVIRSYAESGLSSTACAKVLGRPVLSVRKKAQELGISFHSVRQLTEDEIAFIKTNFGKLTYKQMAEILGCDIRTLQYHGKRMGLTKSRSKNLSEIRKYAGKLTDFEIADLMGLSVGTVRGIANTNRVSLACPERSGRHPWTEQEDEILRRYRPSEGCKSLAKRLGNRTPGAVRTRLRVLGL